MTGLSEKERRYIPRWEVDNKTIYRCDSDQTVHDARTVDLNGAGACILTHQDLEIGQHLKMTIFLADDISIHVHGKVLWLKLETNHNLVGVQFLETSQEVQNLILSHAFEFKRDDIVNHWFKGWEE